MYDSLYQTSEGCDSIVILDLTINYLDTTTTQITACDSYTWLGTTYSVTGVYDSILVNQNGSDSMVFLDLTINNSVINSISDTACDSYIWDGTVYDSSGQYTNTYSSFLGCDSIVFLDLFILNSTISSTIVSSCNSYQWNGNTYTTSGLYDSVFVNSQGCDSVAQIFLTIIQPIITNLDVEACGIYSFAGNNYTLSGIYYDSLNAVSGCDSIVILDLTISNNLSATANIYDVLCYGDSTGQIDLSVGLGIPPYTYQWSNGLTTQDISQLFGDSIYSCLITDSFGCFLDTSFFISQPSALFVNPVVSNILCYGDSTGSVSLNITGGVGNYITNWFNKDPNKLVAGVYDYLVLDSNGCVFTDSVLISEPAQITSSDLITDVECNGDSTASIDLTVSGGTKPYNYAVSYTHLTLPTKA